MKTKFYPLLCAIALGFSIDVSAQQFSFADTIYNASKKSQIETYFTTRSLYLQDYLSEAKEKEPKSYKKFIANREILYQDLIKKKVLYLNTDVDDRISKIYEKILVANKLQTANTRVFVSRDPSINAVSLGDGVILFNLMNLNILENDDEVAFILCHELAHQTLQHLKTSILADIAYKNSSEYKEKARQARSSKDKRTSSRLALLKEYEYEMQAYSRQNELDADSLGFQYFLKVANDPKNALVALSKINTTTPLEFSELTLDDYKAFFSAPQLPFNENWLKENKVESIFTPVESKVDAVGFDKDLLATHPDMDLRIAEVKKSAESLTNKSTTSPVFSKEFRQKIRYESVLSHYLLGEAGRSLYLSLQFLKEDPNDHIAKKLVGNAFAKLSEARKKHKLKEEVDEINPKEQTETYQNFLRILDHLSIEDFMHLAKKYNP